MSVVQQVINDARKLAAKLTDHDSSMDNLLSQTQGVIKQVQCMKEYCDEMNELNEAANTRPRIAFIHSIQQENRHIRELQKENKELRLALEEHQNIMEIIMSKYRQQMSSLISINRNCKNIKNSGNEQAKIIELMTRVNEMAAVMHKASVLNPSDFDEQREMTRLVTENKGLREMLKISLKSGSTHPTNGRNNVETQTCGSGKTNVDNCVDSVKCGSFDSLNYGNSGKELSFSCFDADKNSDTNNGKNNNTNISEHFSMNTVKKVNINTGKKVNLNTGKSVNTSAGKNVNTNTGEKHFKCDAESGLEVSTDTDVDHTCKKDEIFIEPGKSNEIYENNIDSKTTLEMGEIDIRAIDEFGSVEKGEIVTHKVDKSRVDAYKLDKDEVDMHELEKSVVDIHKIDENRVDIHTLEESGLDIHKIDEVDIHRLKEGGVDIHKLDKDGVDIQKSRVSDGLEVDTDTEHMSENDFFQMESPNKRINLLMSEFKSRKENS